MALDLECTEIAKILKLGREEGGCIRTVRRGKYD